MRAWLRGVYRTGWHDVNIDGTSMNVGNRLRERPSTRVHAKHTASTAMQAALSEPF